MRIGFEQLPAIREQATSGGKTIAFMSGCYDLLHEGHVAALEFASDQADLPVVGVRPDARVAERKGDTRPIRAEAVRLIVVDALRSVDYSFIMPHIEKTTGRDPATLQTIRALQPEYFICQQTATEHPNDALIRQLGVQIIFNTITQIESTTAIEQRILAAYEAGREATA